MFNLMEDINIRSTKLKHHPWLFNVEIINKKTTIVIDNQISKYLLESVVYLPFVGTYYTEKVLVKLKET